ncbi:MAG: hypothetical protein Q8R00_04040 [Candidatus Nanoarchaeia archaeon]|nr:hypothetical protein [Candidatus Nanoarchaeia archaeon]
MTSIATTNSNESDFIEKNLPYLGKSLPALAATLPLDMIGALGNMGYIPDDPTSSLMAVAGTMGGYFGRVRGAAISALILYPIGKVTEGVIKYNQGLELEKNLNPDYLKTAAVGGLAALVGYAVNKWEETTGKNAFKTLGNYLLEQGKKGWKKFSTRKPTPYEVKEAEQKAEQDEIKFFKEDLKNRHKEAKLRAWKAKKEARVLKREGAVLTREKELAEKRKALGLYEKADNVVGYAPQGPQEPEVNLAQLLDLDQ